MTALTRAAGMPIAAVLLVAGVLGVQLGNGGGEFEPLRPLDACVERPATSVAEGIDGLTENLVLLGVNNAACTLGTSREALTLELAQPGERTDAQVDALRGGLLEAVEQMKDAGTLPPVSDFVDEALDAADLNRFLDFAIRNLPDSVVDRTLKTDDVLTRAIQDLDLRSLLDNLGDEDDVNKQVQAAVTDAVKDSLKDRLQDLLP
jgi:hypothetical protein